MTFLYIFLVFVIIINLRSFSSKINEGYGPLLPNSILKVENQPIAFSIKTFVYPWEYWNKVLVTGCSAWRQPARIREEMLQSATSPAVIEFCLRTFNKSDFDCDVQLNWEPVQLFQNWCYVNTLSGACDHSSQRVDDLLNFVEVRNNGSVQYWIAIVMSGTNNWTDHRSCRMECLAQLSGTICSFFSFSFMVQKRNSTSAEEVARFQHLFPNPSWLMSGRTSGHQKIVPTFLWIDNCLMVTKRYLMLLGNSHPCPWLTLEENRR